MSLSRIKLFETVLNIHEKGAASLTASERSIVESETRDLLNAAGHKQAAMAPPGFDKLLMDLKMSENPDDAFGMVVQFLEGQGDIKPEMPGMGMPGPGLEMPGPGLDMPGPSLDMPGDGLDAAPLGGPKLPLPKLDKGLPELDKGMIDAPLMDGPGDLTVDEPKDGPIPMKLDKDLEPPKDSPSDKKEDPMDIEDKKEEPKEDKKDDDKKEFPFDKKKEDKSDDKEDKSEDKEDKSDDKEDKSDKEALVDKVAELKVAEEDKKEEDKKDDKNEDDKEDPKEDKEDDKKEASATPKVADRVHVRILKNRSILASFDDKPMFIAHPKKDTKQDLEATKRLANRVFGWIVYEGPKVAAENCKAKLMAGVDDNVQPVFDEALTPAATDPVVAEGDDLIKDELETPADAVPADAEFDTQETPDKVTAGVDDDAEFVTDPAPDAMPNSALADEETVHTEPLDGPTDSSQAEADVDFQSVEGNFKKLYASRAHKLAKEANEQFVKKFVKCVKIASQRMLLNHDDNPYKAASMDVLANEQEFANGDSFVGLHDQDASELIEMIASKGQEEFVTQLLDRTANLMKKSEEYLGDLEGDLGDLNIQSVEVTEKTSKVASTDNESMKQAAIEGNFLVNTNTGSPVTASQNNNEVGGIRNAMGNTRLSKRSRALRELKA